MEVSKSQIMTFAGFVPVDDINPQGTFMSRNKPLIIQLLGQARSGKDWTAEQLKQLFEAKGMAVSVKSYAAPMKRIAAKLFDISLEELDRFKNNPNHYSIWACVPSTHAVLNHFNFRVFLQRLGNDAVKPEFGDAVWADLMMISIAKSDADVIIITDCRFTVELDSFPQATTIRVINSTLPTPMNHASELETADYQTTYTIDNTDYKLTQSELSSIVDSILKS